MTNEDKSKIIKLKRLGKSYSEISKETGISVGSIKSFISRNSSAATDSCKFCGAPITQTEGKRKKEFCSDKCRANWWNINRTKSEAFYEKVCPCCNKTFKVYGRAEQKFCSHACYVLFKNRKGTEANG